MNQRIKNKKLKQYHKQFCRGGWNPKTFDYDGTCLAEWQCPKCGWDTLEADEEMAMGKILWSRGDFYDYEFEIEYKCPVCGTVFSYCEGN